MVCSNRFAVNFPFFCPMLECSSRKCSRRMELNVLAFNDAAYLSICQRVSFTAWSGSFALSFKCFSTYSSIAVLRVSSRRRSNGDAPSYSLAFHSAVLVLYSDALARACSMLRSGYWPIVRHVGYPATFRNQKNDLCPVGVTITPQPRTCES